MVRCEEAKFVSFGDKRLARRLRKILNLTTSSPSSTIPEACKDWANTKATYRFFDNQNVTPEKIREAHFKTTLERIKPHSIILVVEDTSPLNFSTHFSTKGLGILKSVKERGLMMHSALAVTPIGLPLGLLDQAVWARQYVGNKKYPSLRARRKIDEKESYKWLRTTKHVTSLVPESKKLVFISDRESDIFELFDANRKANTDFLLRSSRDRYVLHNNIKQKLRTLLDKTPASGTIKIMLHRKHGGAPREAILEVKYSKTEFLPPKTGYNYYKNLTPITLNVVEAKERESPFEKVDWVLLTTLPVESFKDAVKIIEWYSYRWLIERYHYTLKSGCKVEELQLETAERLKKALAVYCTVAWRLLWMTYAARKTPDAPANILLEQDEWKALSLVVGKGSRTAGKPLTVKEAVMEIAKLGGFLARRSDKHPGVKTIWRGFRRLQDFTLFYRILSKRYRITEIH